MSRIYYIVQPGKGANFKSIAARAAKPFAGDAGRIVARVMRQGPGSVGDQFAQQATIGASGTVVNWVPSKPFGRKPAPSQTLMGKGRLRAAWQGEGAGAVTITETNRVAIGVDRRVVPYAAVFQSRTATTVRANPGNRTKSGQLAMRMFLGMQYGAWISEAKLLSGLVIQPRPLAVNPIMEGRATAVVRAYILTGTAQEKAA